MIDVASLIAGIAPDSPCGPDLEYDPEFVELARLAEGTPERQTGDRIEPAREPEWPEVQRRALALFTRTKDLRVAVLLTRALTRAEGLAGLAGGLALIGELLTRYWDGVHPVVDPDDHDPTARLNSLAPLTLAARGDPSALMRDVWAASICTSPAGRVCVREVLVAANLLQPGAGAGKLGEGELDGLLRAAAAKGALPLDAAQSAARALDGIRGTLGEKVDAATAPNLQPLGDALTAVVKALRSASGIAESAETPASGDTLAHPDAAPPAPGGLELRGREDVVRQLDRICEFIARTEPGNPAPLLIRRAQRLMSKDFLEIIKDLAPGSLGDVQKIAGIE